MYTCILSYEYKTNMLKNDNMTLNTGIWHSQSRILLESGYDKANAAFSCALENMMNKKKSRGEETKEEKKRLH